MEEKRYRIAQFGTGLYGNLTAASYGVPFIIS